jgi:hypothetical protein
MNIKIRNARGSYKNIDPTDLSPDYVVEAENMAFKPGYSVSEEVTFEGDVAFVNMPLFNRTRGSFDLGTVYQEGDIAFKDGKFQTYEGAQWVEASEAVELECLEYVYLTEDRLRLKATELKGAQRRVAVMVVKTSTNASLDGTIPASVMREVYISDMAQGNTLEKKLTVTDPTASRAKVRVVPEDGKVRIFTPSGSYTVAMVKGEIAVYPMTPRGYHWQEYLSATAKNSEVKTSNAMVRRVTLGVYDKKRQWRYVFCFLRCDSQGHLVSGQDTFNILTELQKDMPGAYENAPFYGLSYDVVLSNMPDMVDNQHFVTQFYKETYPAASNPITGLKDVEIATFSGQRFFEGVDNDRNHIVDQERQEALTYFGGFYTSGIDSTVWRDCLKFPVHYTKDSEPVSVPSYGFEYPVKVLVTMVTDACQETLAGEPVKIDGSRNGAKYLVHLSLKNFYMIPKEVTHIRVYLKELKDEDDKSIDFELFHEFNLLDAALKKDADLIRTDSTGIVLTQMIGLFYDSQYTLLDSAEDYASVGGMSFILNQGMVYPAAVGGGNVMTGVYYRQNMMNLSIGDPIVKIANINKQLALHTNYGVHMVVAEKIGGEYAYYTRQGLDLGIKDYGDIEETLEGAIINTAQGIFMTDGYKKTLLSEPINNIVEENFPHSSIFLNRQWKELYFSTGRVVWRMNMVTGAWDKLTWTGTDTMNYAEVVSDHTGSINVYNAYSVKRLKKNPRTSQSIMRFMETDQGEVSVMKMITTIDVDMYFGDADPSGTSSIMWGIGRMINPLNSANAVDRTKDKGVAMMEIPFQYSVTLNGTTVWYNALKGRQTVRLAVPLEKVFKGSDGMDYLVAMRTPETIMKFEMITKNIEVRIYNIQINFEPVAEARIFEKPHMGYGSHYGSLYGRRL